MTCIEKKNAHPIDETHALETLLSSLVLSRLLSTAATKAPTVAVDEGTGGPERRRLAALRDGVVKDPLDRLVELLQALVEEAEVAERRRRAAVGRRPARLGWGCRGRLRRRRLRG